MAAPGEHDEDRRKLFRRMEWLYVYGPPIVAVLVALAAGSFLAWFVQIEGTTYVGRWVAVSAIIIAVPLMGQLVRGLWRRRR